MPTDIWIVLIEDRHADVDALPFTAEQAAIAYARSEAGDEARDEQLNPAMLADGWVLYLPYGLEGDCVRVVKRTMDAIV